jgi:hypothetical protein
VYQKHRFLENFIKLGLEDWCLKLILIVMMIYPQQIILV